MSTELTVEEHAELLIDTLLVKIRERKSEFIELAEELEEESNPKVKVDSALTLGPQKLIRKPEADLDEEHYGMAVEKSLGGIGRARDWVNSTEGYSSPFATDDGFLILSDTGGYDAQWVKTGQVLITSPYGGFTTYTPHGWQLPDEEAGTGT